MFFCIARQQCCAIKDQLLLGVRFLDLRLHLTDSETSAEIRVSHSLDTDYTLGAVLDEVSDFLIGHPTEFVILYLRVDHWFRKDNDKNERALKILQGLLDSGAPFADRSLLASFGETKVRDVAGRICLMVPDNGTVVPKGTKGIGYIDSSRFYKVLDVWDSCGLCGAKSRVDAYMRSRSGVSNPGVLQGVCLDITVSTIPPGLTSPGLNRWFLEKIRSDPEWSKSSDIPLGLLMVDFVDEDLVSQLFEVFYPELQV